MIRDKISPVSKRSKKPGLIDITFLNKAISKNINSSNILNYWEGPEGGLHDFKFPKFLLEIKII